MTTVKYYSGIAVKVHGYRNVAGGQLVDIEVIGRSPWTINRFEVPVELVKDSLT